MRLIRVTNKKIAAAAITLMLLVEGPFIGCKEKIPEPVRPIGITEKTMTDVERIAKYKEEKDTYKLFRMASDQGKQIGIRIDAAFEAIELYSKGGQVRGLEDMATYSEIPLTARNRAGMEMLRYFVSRNMKSEIERIAIDDDIPIKVREAAKQKAVARHD